MRPWLASLPPLRRLLETITIPKNTTNAPHGPSTDYPPTQKKALHNRHSRGSPWSGDPKRTSQNEMSASGTSIHAPTCLSLLPRLLVLSKSKSPLVMAGLSLQHLIHKTTTGCWMSPAVPAVFLLPKRARWVQPCFFWKNTTRKAMTVAPPFQSGIIKSLRNVFHGWHRPFENRLLSQFMVLGQSVSVDYSKYHNAADDASSGFPLFKQHAGCFSFFFHYYLKVPKWSLMAGLALPQISLLSTP